MVLVSRLKEFARIPLVQLDAGERCKEDMDQAGVAMSLISITYPGIWLSGSNVPVDATRRLARECNEYGATMVADHKGRYGLFAVLPIPDIEGSLREIEEPD